PWVDARISIETAAVDWRGRPRTFTAKVEQDTGTGAFVPAPDRVVSIDLSATNGALPDPAGPLTCTTNAAGECEASFSARTAGTVTGAASATLSVAGSPSFTVSTDGMGGSSAAATGTLVDARIAILETDRSPWSQSHTVTATLEQHTGTGDWLPAD